MLHTSAHYYDLIVTFDNLCWHAQLKIYEMEKFYIIYWQLLKRDPDLREPFLSNNFIYFYFLDDPQLNAQIPAKISSGACKWYFAITILNFQNLCIPWDNVYCSDSLSKWEDYSAQNWSQSICKRIQGYWSREVTKEVSYSTIIFLMKKNVSTFCILQL